MGKDGALQVLFQRQQRWELHSIPVGKAGRLRSVSQGVKVPDKDTEEKKKYNK